MTTMTISSLSEVEPGDLVTLEQDGVTITGIETPCMNRGHIEIPWHGPERHYACTDDGWEFVTATRKVSVDRVALREGILELLKRYGTANRGDISWDITDFVENQLQRGGK